MCKREHDGKKIMCEECIEKYRDDMYEYMVCHDEPEEQGE
jgi:hypothetical protein